MSNRAIEDLRLLALTRAYYAASYGIYGAIRVFLDLKETSEAYGRNSAAKISDTMI